MLVPTLGKGHVSLRFPVKDLCLPAGRKTSAFPGDELRLFKRPADLADPDAGPELLSGLGGQSTLHMNHLEP
jgi:hypothetical protein